MSKNRTSPDQQSAKTEPSPSFVPRRPRHDGWTADRQQQFLETLAETGSVTAAARSVRMDRRSAYVLRRGPNGEAFARAWDAALDCAVQNLHEAAMSRALHGVPRPIVKNGEQVGEWRHFDERLTMFLLRTRAPQKFGRWLEVERPDVEPLDPDAVLAAFITSRQLTEYGVAFPRKSSEDRPTFEELLSRLTDDDIDDDPIEDDEDVDVDGTDAS